MDITFVFRGLLIGFSIAAPVGPIGVLCIRRTLAEGRLYGLISGLGAATADAAYGLVAGFGLTFISTFLVDQGIWLRLIGGIFLLYLGVRTIASHPAMTSSSEGKRDKSLLAAYASIVGLTLTNPATILSFAVVFAGLGLATGSADYADATLLVVGVFLGSASWWLLLSGAVSLLRSRFTYAGLWWVNRVSGIIITGFGVLALISTLTTR
ncbi:MAG: LysE family transporter [Chloroflexota bacterium]